MDEETLKRVLEEYDNWAAQNPPAPSNDQLAQQALADYDAWAAQNPVQATQPQQQTIPQVMPPASSANTARQTGGKDMNTLLESIQRAKEKVERSPRKDGWKNDIRNLASEEKNDGGKKTADTAYLGQARLNVAGRKERAKRNAEKTARRLREREERQQQARNEEIWNSDAALPGAGTRQLSGLDEMIAAANMPQREYTEAELQKGMERTEKFNKQEDRKAQLQHRTERYKEQFSADRNSASLLAETKAKTFENKYGFSARDYLDIRRTSMEPMLDEDPEMLSDAYEVENAYNKAGLQDLKQSGEAFLTGAGAPVAQLGARVFGDEDALLDFEAQERARRELNPVATGAGTLTNKALQYYGISKLGKAIGATGKIASGLQKIPGLGRLLGGIGFAEGNGIAALGKGFLTDQIADLAVNQAGDFLVQDLPNYISNREYMSDEDALSQLGSDMWDNARWNMAINGLGLFGSSLMQGGRALSGAVDDVRAFEDAIPRLAADDVAQTIPEVLPAGGLADAARNADVIDTTAREVVEGAADAARQEAGDIPVRQADDIVDSVKTDIQRQVDADLDTLFNRPLRTQDDFDGLVNDLDSVLAKYPEQDYVFDEFIRRSNDAQDAMTQHVDWMPDRVAESIRTETSVWRTQLAEAEAAMKEAAPENAKFMTDLQEARRHMDEYQYAILHGADDAAQSGRNMVNAINRMNTQMKKAGLPEIPTFGRKAGKIDPYSSLKTVDDLKAANSIEQLPVDENGFVNMDAVEEADDIFALYGEGADNYARPVMQSDEITEEMARQYDAEFEAARQRSVAAARDDGTLTLRATPEQVKQKQFDAIQKSNPAPDDYHTWIREPDEIKTFDEAWREEPDIAPDFTDEMAQEAMRTGKITVYSSQNIENGAFVTPSYMEAVSYAGDPSNVKSATVNLDDVAWIDSNQGQLARISDQLATARQAAEQAVSGQRPAPVYNDRFVEPEKLVMQGTGEQVSPEFAAAVRKLESGGELTKAEYDAIPEVRDARARADFGEDSATYKIQTPERDALREDIVRELNERGSASGKYIDPVDGKRKTAYNGIVERGRRADIVIGLPGSGKSSAIVDPISNKYHSRLIDSDEAKELLSEFDGGYGAGRVHKESKDIMAAQFAQAVESGDNIVMPIVGSDADKVLRYVDELRANGYTVNLHLNELDANAAAARNLRRFANDNRFLDFDDTVFAYGNKPTDVYEQITKGGLVDGYTRISNDVPFGSKPIQVEGTEDIPFDWETSGRGGGLLLGEPGEISREAQSAGLPNPEAGSVIPRVEPQTGGAEIPAVKESADDLTEIGRERSYARNVRTQRVEGVADDVAANFKDNPEIYNVVKNAETTARAQEIMDQGLDAARNQFDVMLNDFDPASIPLGHSIAKELSAQGNHEAAAEVLRNMAQKLTKSGQFSQAAAITMMKDDPMTALQYAMRQIDDLNQAGAKRFGKKWKNFDLTDAEKALFDDIKPGDADAIKDAFDKIGTRLGKEYPTTLMDRILEGRKISMLFNVRTNVRNVLANLPTYGMRWMSDRVEALGQHAYKLINPDFEITQSLRGGGGDGGRIAKEIFEGDIGKSLQDSTFGKYEMPELRGPLMNNLQMYKGTRLDKWIDKVTGGGIQKINKKLFGKEGVQSVPESFRNATYKLLDLGDSPFVKANFESRLGSYINARGIKSAADVPEEAIQMAWEEAMKATYKDNSWAVNVLSKIRGGIGDWPYVGRPLSQAAIPFVQAPGNIAARMVDYSPIRGTKGITDIIRGAKNADADLVRKGIEEAAKGFTGTGLVILGMKLHDSGVLTGTYSQDADQRQFQKQTGYREFALHIGDHYLTYDWAQPFAMPLMIGTLLGDAIQKSDEYDSDILRYFGIEGSTAGKILGGLKESSKTIVNAWFDESPLQGLQELMGGNKDQKTNYANIAGNLGKVGIENFAQSFVPASLAALAKGLDPVQRNVTDKSNSFGTQINTVQSKIPGLSDDFPAKYDTWGREVRTAESVGGSLAAKFLIPGDYSYDRSEPIDTEINRLFEATGDKGVFPQVAPNDITINGNNRKMTNSEVSQYQQTMGQMSYDLANQFVNDAAYQEMSDPDRAEVMAKLYGVSKALTERELIGKEPSSTYKKLVAAYDENGVEGVIGALAGKKLLNDAGLATGNSEKVKEAVNQAATENGAEAAEAMVSGMQRFEQAGLKAYDYTHFQQAQQKIPSLTEDAYINAYSIADRDSNRSLKQDEIIFLMNSDKGNAEQWQTVFWTNPNWKKIPVLQENGEWKAK